MLRIERVCPHGQGREIGIIPFKVLHVFEPLSHVERFELSAHGGKLCICPGIGDGEVFSYMMPRVIMPTNTSTNIRSRNLREFINSRPPRAKMFHHLATKAALFEIFS